MEYIDILDHNGDPTGEIKTRKEVHSKGLWHKAVHVWILNDKNELLIQKRSAQKQSHSNMWDISIAGHIEAGDDSIVTAKREAKEELGLELDKTDLKYLFTIRQQSVQNDGTYFNNEFDDVFLVKVKMDIGELNLQDDEVAEVKFIKFQELKDLIDRRDNSFVMHDEEYAGLFEYLNNTNNMEDQNKI
jgi:isopentenyl-diphosphate Delta-isomerase